MRASRFTALALLTSLGHVPAAQAATATATFQVTATVAATCSATTTNLGFGTYTGAQIDQTNTIDVTCTNGTTYTVGLNNGANYSAPNRRMTNGTNFLNYDLYNDAPGGTRWGDGSGTVNGTGNGMAQTLTVYGRLPAGQTLYTGSYTDTIQVTITY